MRDVDALVHVVAAFPGPDGAPAAPIAQLENFAAELILADLGIIEKRLERLKKEKGKEREQQLLERCGDHLGTEQPLRTLPMSAAEVSALAGFNLLSRMPLLLLLNVGESMADQPVAADVAAHASARQLEVVAVPGKTEMEVSELDEADRAAFLADLGIEVPAKDRFIRAAYGLLDLISFLTAGEDECRAWPIRRGTTGRQGGRQDSQRHRARVHSRRSGRVR